MLRCNFLAWPSHLSYSVQVKFASVRVLLLLTCLYKDMPTWAHTLPSCSESFVYLICHHLSNDKS